MAQLGFWSLAQKDPEKLALVDPTGQFKNIAGILCRPMQIADDSPEQSV